MHDSYIEDGVVHQDSKMFSVEHHCCEPMERGKRFCNMHKDHRGRHCSVAIGCDGCNRMMRGAPAAYARDGEYEQGMRFCFLCVKEAERYELKTRYLEYQEGG